MNWKEIEAFARKAAKGIKTEKDLNNFSQLLTKTTIEAALNAKLDDHLGYDKHETSNNSNSRNGYSSKTLISRVTDAVIEQVIEWQSRPLDPIYPIVYLDCIVVKIRQDKRVINKAIYLALGVNPPVAG